LPTQDPAIGNPSPRQTPALNGDSLPSLATARIVSTVVVVHFFLISLSYSSTVASSTTQVRILDAIRPYLGMTHFDADGLPLSFAVSDRSEKNHLLQQSTKSRGETEEDWTAIENSAMAGSDRQRRWQRFLAAIAELGNNEQTALAAWLVEPLAIANPEAKKIRITRQPDLMTTVVDDSASAPYAAAIVRQENGSVRLVQLPPPRMAAKSRGEDRE